MKNKKTVYLLAGGNWRKPEALIPVIQSILQASGKEKPRIAYVGAASQDDAVFFKLLKRFFLQAGAGAVAQVLLASPAADVAAAKKTLKSADAVFISGGDVEEGMRWLVRHRLQPYLKKLAETGVLFFGLSAGTIMLGTHWVRWSDPDNEDTAELFACLGIAPIVCDTHAEKDDWEELKTAVRLLGPAGVGYGIPTGGLIQVTATGALCSKLKPAVSYTNQNHRVIKSGTLPPGVWQ